MLLLMGVAVSRMSFLRPPSPPPAAIGGKDVLQLKIALGALIAEVVGFVNENHIHVSHLAGIEIIDGEALLCDDICRDGHTVEFIFPYGSERGWANHQRLLPHVVRIIF